MNRIRKGKGIIAAFLCLVLTMSTFSMTAFAYYDETAAAEEETVSDNSVPEEEPVSYDPLTPDGNLSLADDLGEPDKVGKQFITVSTKTGNIFYLIIDRDDEGENTVHFLNQVDEADLLKLMEEEEAAEYQKPEPIPETVSEPEVPEVEEPKKTNLGPVLFLLLAVVGGCGIFLYMKAKEKKEKDKRAKGDPDEDYEYEDFLEELPEEVEEIPEGEEQDTSMDEELDEKE